MSGFLAVMLFGVGYPVIALAGACLGVFGLAANKYENSAAMRRNALFDSPDAGTYLFGWGWRILGCLLAGCAWPVALPMWFAWRKGSFVADALEKRAEMEAAS